MFKDDEDREVCVYAPRVKFTTDVSCFSEAVALIKVVT